MAPIAKNVSLANRFSTREDCRMASPTATRPKAGPETLLEPQLTQGQYLLIPKGGRNRGEAYGAQQRDGITVYASLKITGNQFRLHLIVWNQRKEEIAWDKEKVLLTSKDGEPFPFRLVGKGFSDGPIRPGVAAGGNMYFGYDPAREAAAILTLSLEQEELSFRFGLPSPGPQKLTPDQLPDQINHPSNSSCKGVGMPSEQISARLKTHTISPLRSAIIEMARKAEIFPGEQFSFPPLPFRNKHCLCVNCMGLLWSPRCEIPINWLHPHEGDRCPYCNGRLLIHRLEKDWPTDLDTLYRLLVREQAKSCDNCRCWL